MIKKFVRFTGITINSLKLFFRSNLSLLEACRYAGFYVPRFCYHELLSVAGNCRMCLVELKFSVKPLAACAAPVASNMHIYLDTPLVLKARENIVEALLLNHPLDCPICDQAGECDLQDQAKKFGSDRSRFFMPKRGVEDKIFSPLILTVMTRCIHCTRCIRFSAEILGTEVLGLLNRGKSTEVGNYKAKLLMSELTGNIIDLCPVGALTSKSYGFKSRPWELRSSESIDLTDGFGSNIIINFKDLNVFRIMPKPNKGLNGSLISDVARYFFDSLNSQRLFSIYTKQVIKDKVWLIPEEKVVLQSLKLLENETLVIVDDTLDLETLNAFKILSYLQPNNIKLRSIKQTFANSNFFLSTFTSSIKNILKSKIFFLISTNLKLESAILNSKIRMKFIKEDIQVYKIGGNFNLNFYAPCINLSLSFLLLLLEGKNRVLKMLRLKLFHRQSLFVIGESVLKRGISFTMLRCYVLSVLPKALFLQILTSCNSSGHDFSGIQKITTKDLIISKKVAAINLKETSQVFRLVKKNFSLSWWNTHGPKYIGNISQVLVPLLPSLHENLIYVNLEQRSQKTNKIFSYFPASKKRYAYSLQTELLKLFGKFKDVNLSFLNFYRQIIGNSELFNVNYKFVFYRSVEIEKISLLHIKMCLEDSFSFSKEAQYSKTLSLCSLALRQSVTNFSS